MVQFHFPQLFDNQQLTTRAGAARHNSFSLNDLYDFPVLGHFLKQEKHFFEERGCIIPEMHYINYVTDRKLSVNHR